MNLAIGRGKYIDQSQSLNIHFSEPSISKISSMHFYAWKNGLKTGMYYLRTRPAVDAIKFTLNVEELLKATDGNNTDEVLKVMKKLDHKSETDLRKTSSISQIESSTGLDKLNGNHKSDKKSNETREYQEKEDEVCISCSG